MIKRKPAHFPGMLLKTPINIPLLTPTTAYTQHVTLHLDLPRLLEHSHSNQHASDRLTNAETCPAQSRCVGQRPDCGRLYGYAH
jgi:hypothetical protein